MAVPRAILAPHQGATHCKSGGDEDESATQHDDARSTGCDAHDPARNAENRDRSARFSGGAGWGRCISPFGGRRGPGGLLRQSALGSGKHRQLFLSEICIEKMSGLKRTLHQPRKLGPVLRPDRSQGQTSLQSSSPPQWNSEKSIWEWWYRGANAFYATSTDGVNWVRPLLKLYELNGSKDNNIAYTPGQRSLAHVIRDEKEADPKRRYKALFSNSGRDRWPAVSPDGFHWTFQEGPPIPSRDTSMFTYDEISEQYLALVKLPTEWGRSVWLATSKDFVRFTDPKLILHADEIDRENCAQRVREVMNNPAVHQAAHIR